MMKGKRFWPALAAALLLFPAGPAAAGASVTVPDPGALDAILDRHVDEGFYPFLHARLENANGDPIYEHSAVNERLLPGLQVGGDTWIRIWSMSKIVTITVVLDLVEEGMLSLDDPVTEYIPEFSDLRVAMTPDGRSLSEARRSESAAEACPLRLVATQSAMTLMQLIVHEAGFYYALNGIPCLDEPLSALNLVTSANTGEFIGRLAQLPLIHQPGSSYHYGLNTTVLGFVAERATGKSLAQLVRERLTGPLGIEGLRYGLPPGAELIQRTSGRDGALREAHPGELDIFGPDVPGYDPAHELYLGGEGMLATADGYADYLRMLLNGGSLNGYRFLDASTVEDIHAPHTVVDEYRGHNGMNLWVSGPEMRDRDEGEAGLWIGGGYEGTHFWVDPKRRFVAVIMTQMSWVSPGGRGRDAAFRGALYRQFRAAAES